MKTLMKIEAEVIRVEKVAVAVTLGLLLAVGILQVLVRLFGFRSIGTDEIASTSMVLLVFVGAALTIATNDSIAVEVADFLPSARVRWVLSLLVHLVTVVFGITFTYFALQLTGVVLESGEKSLQLAIPKALPTSIMAFGGLLLTLHALLRIPPTLAMWRNPEMPKLSETLAHIPESQVK